MLIDGHCDALYKMWREKTDFLDDHKLDVSYKKWMDSPVKVQCFAIYVPEDVSIEAKFSTALAMVDLFYEKIIKPFHSVCFIQKKTDIEELDNHEKGAILTLEGLDCIGNDLYKLRILLQLGVQMIGMSWNNPNYAVDGLMETRGAGLSDLGHEVIELANKEKRWIDLAHISEQGFAQAIKLAEYPVVSHANSATICPHPRNLTDNHIRQLISKNGLIGITFVREFVSHEPLVTTEHLMQHIEHMLSLGAERALMFGSDFDGTDSFTNQLSSIDQYQAFFENLQKTFSYSIVNQISYKNFINHFPK